MKALTICQPYAHLIAIGEKPIENRTWETSYRGPLLIHAGKSRSWLEPEDAVRHADMVFGAIVAIARIAVCLYHQGPSWPAPYAHLRDHEHANGPWCWVLADVRRLKAPVLCVGALGLWEPPPDVLVRVQGQLVNAGATPSAAGVTASAPASSSKGLV